MINTRELLVIKSNRVIEDWSKLLGDAEATSEFLDSLTHPCKMLDFEELSLRVKEFIESVAKEKGKTGQRESPRRVVGFAVSTSKSN